MWTHFVKSSFSIQSKQLNSFDKRFHKKRNDYKRFNHDQNQEQSQEDNKKKGFFQRPKVRKISYLLLGSFLLGSSYLGYQIYQEKKEAIVQQRVLKSLDKYLTVIDSREKMISKMKGVEFDLIVVGGGVTGAGVALDAATRGLKVALVEKNDFGAATSSRSTKLIHGGVRYLEKAFWDLDYGQYALVQEALNERSVLLKNTRHLSSQLPILLPIKSWIKVPYFWAGSKAYDLIAGSQGLEPSYYVSKERALELFPVLNPDSVSAGAMVYHDGTTNDSRLVLSLIQTAASFGAKVANYVSADSFIRDDDGKITGIVAKDELSGESFSVRAKGVISCTGPFTDEIRKIDDPNCGKLVVPSAGVHIVLPAYYSPANMGLLDPETSDGRVIFFLPWYNYTIAGTTDTPSDVSLDPVPLETDIHFILNEVSKLIDPSIKVRRGDVKAAWSGIRPLVLDPSKQDTQSLSRTHVISETDSNLLLVSGGKLTTYRKMAEEAVDHAIELFDLDPDHKKALTEYIPVIGSRGWNAKANIKLIHKFGLSNKTAAHLSTSYGTRSEEVMNIANSTGLTERFISDLPLIEGEVLYSVEREFAQRAVDFIARRSRIAFVDAQKASEVLPRVIEIMGDALNWSPERRVDEEELAKEFLVTMGLPKNSEKIQNAFEEMELIQLREAFYQSDFGHHGVIPASEVLHAFSRIGVTLDFDYRDILDGDFVSYQTFLEIAQRCKERGDLHIANVPKIPHSLTQYRNSSEVVRSGGGF
eukprot:TRINITY_DN10625_c0_g1_i1.p1 TRINITY_DN10625_c0_g1~~TRINITY_DN10625_c0_g1_i1.p1  ORF type:complete len:757 (-),score=189.99 TRINITY_DN10625_c0_g1_i1:1154-3424(-)